MDPDRSLNPDGSLKASAAPPHDADGPLMLPERPDAGAADAAGRPAPVIVEEADTGESAHDYSDGIGELLERIAHPDRRMRIAIVDDRASISYGRLAERCSRFGAGLARAGVTVGDRVFLCLLDTMDWPMAFLGTLQVGAVPVCADTRLDAAAYETMLRDSQARLLVVSRSLYPAFDGLLQRIDSLARVEISEAPLADGGDMTVLLALDEVIEAPARSRHTEVCRLRDGARSQGWFDAVTVPTGEGQDTRTSRPHVEPTDRCLSTGRLCEPAILEQVLLPTLSAGGSLVLIAEEQGPRAIRSRLDGHLPEHLEGKAPTLLFTTERDLHALLAEDGLPPPANPALRAIVLLDDGGDAGVADAAMGRTGVAVIRARPIDEDAHPVRTASPPARDGETVLAPVVPRGEADPLLVQSCVYRPAPRPAGVKAPSQGKENR